jgi:hypothetical protein
LEDILTFKALRAFYPEVSAERPVYWKDKANQKAFFDQVAIKWNIQKPEDWYKVTKEMAFMEGGRFIGTYYNGSLIKGKVIIISLNQLVLISSSIGLSFVRVEAF